MGFLAEILEADVEFRAREFRTPLQLSSGTIDGLTEAQVTVRVRVEGREAVGAGSVYLSDLWAWPGPGDHADKDDTLRSVCERLAAALTARYQANPTHPLAIGLWLHEWMGDLAAQSEIPRLALNLCASPFDAAVHDATGIATNTSAFDFYADGGPAVPSDQFFPSSSTIEAIRTTIRAPERELAAWLVVSSGQFNDRQLAPWIVERGYRCFKLKISGVDPETDAEETARLVETVGALGVRSPRVSVDANCASPNAECVREYLTRLQKLSGEAYDALEYLEQPTARDIKLARQDWSDVTRLKPIVLDEGLVSMEALVEARRQGWSGVALKACKGHSFMLVAAAWAARNNMTLFMQDLTSVSTAAIHSALLAAHLPAQNGLELNSVQFSPDANARWLPRLSTLFEPADGHHHVPWPIPPGLGTTL